MRKLVFIMLMTALTAVQSLAQTRIITGTVTDEKGNPVSGATIQVKGSRKGTSTSVDGTFSIEVPANSKAIEITSVGMTSQELPLGGNSFYSIKMTAGEKALQEVVVVGYGTQRRKEITGSLSSVKGTAIAEKPVQSFEQALAGKAAGVQITNPNGLLNNPPVFRIRGTNSLSLSSYPLVVIDGVPTFTGDQGSTSAPANPLASINPSDIESVDIAKDAAATAIYGSRAANGVVFVTTKKGKQGKAKVTYDGWVGWSEETRLPKILDAFQYTDYKNLAVANAKANNPATTGGFNLTNDANGNPINTNWYDYVYRKAFSHSHSVNVSGGNDNTTYYFSAGYTAQQGVIRKNNFNRINALLNVDSRVNKIMSIGGKLAYSNELNQAGGSSGGLTGDAFNIANAAREAIVLPPNISPYNNDGSYNIASGSAAGSMGDIVNGSGVVTYYNPVMTMNLNRSNNENNHLQSNVYLQLKPVDWITLRSTYGIDNLLIDNDIFYNPFHGDGAGNSQGPGGGAYGILTKEKTWLWTNTAQFDYSLHNHNLSFLLGNEQQRSTINGFGVNRRTLSDSAYTVVQGGFTSNAASGLNLGENYLLSTFGRLNYNYDRKYYISGNLRKDEYSALGVKQGIFWGASAGWEIAKENFWNKTHLDNIFSNFKLRGSYGKVGNVGGISNYATFSTYSSGIYGGLPTLGFNIAGNPKIQWETSKKLDLGISFGILRDRIQAEVAYYKNNIDNLILAVPQSPSAGLPNSILQNVGSMYNKGVEISLNTTPIQNKDFSWTSTFNLTFNTNKVTQLAPGLSEILNSVGGGNLEYVTKTVSGMSIGQIWVVRTGGVDPATGRRIFINKAGNKILYEYGTLPAGRYNFSNVDGTKYQDQAGNALQINQSDDGVLYAPTQPKGYGGWDNAFRYKAFDINITFTYQFGNYIYYGTNAGLHDQRFWNNTTDVLNAWKKTGDVTSIPKPVFGDNTSNGSGIPLDINVFKGDYIKMRSIQFGYNISKKALQRLMINNARLYVSAQNLLIITKYPGPDPEVSTDGNSNQTQGIDRNTVPSPRTITIGLNVNF